MKTLYGLLATGDSLVFSNPFRMFSKVLFLTKEKAEEYIPEFTDRCCDEKHLECCDRKTIKIKSVTYELDETT